jgi:hypothetical protein
MPAVKNSKYGEIQQNKNMKYEAYCPNENIKYGESDR